MRRRGRGFADHEIDEAIDEWHARSDDWPGLELHDYLGWGWREYAAWVFAPESLSIIVLRGEPR